MHLTRKIGSWELHLSLYSPYICSGINTLFPHMKVQNFVFSIEQNHSKAMKISHNRQTDCDCIVSLTRIFVSKESTFYIHVVVAYKNKYHISTLSMNLRRIILKWHVGYIETHIVSLEFHRVNGSWRFWYSHHTWSGHRDLSWNISLLQWPFYL